MMMKNSTTKTNTLVIRTPEGVSFPLHLAGPTTRSVAWFVDFACILLLQNIITYSLIFLKLLSPAISQAIALILYFALNIAYGIILEWFWDGKTLGKKLSGLRVVDAEGLKLTFPQVVMRNLMRFIDIFPMFFLTGGITCVLTRKYQRLGDLAAQTVVVRTVKAGRPDIATLISDKYNSFKDHPHIAARLRNDVPAEIAALVLKALIRRKTLEIGARTEIYESLVGLLKTFAKFPQEATDGLSDERFLKNTVEILYGGRTA
ncbi:MAG: RDD family protein [Victivallales bacterium]|nr:RDD family protein [Victivallales bacterium]